MTIFVRVCYNTVGGGGEGGRGHSHIKDLVGVVLTFVNVQLLENKLLGYQLSFVSSLNWGSAWAVHAYPKPSPPRTWKKLAQRKL